MHKCVIAERANVAIIISTSTLKHHTLRITEIPHTLIYIYFNQIFSMILFK